MVQPASLALAALYETDETAWLDATEELVRSGRLNQVDAESLAEYLADMAGRDRREVVSRLAQLLAHLLKWQFQPERRSGSWRESVELQRQELADLLESGVLRNHAEDVLDKAYSKAKRLAAAETGLAETAFPEECFFTLDEILSEPLDEIAE